MYYSGGWKWQFRVIYFKYIVYGVCLCVFIYVYICVCVREWESVCGCVWERERERGEIEIAAREQDKTIKILEVPCKSYFTPLPSGQAGRQDVLLAELEQSEAKPIAYWSSSISTSNNLQVRLACIDLYFIACHLETYEYFYHHFYTSCTRVTAVIFIYSQAELELYLP